MYRPKVANLCWLAAYLVTMALVAMSLVYLRRQILAGYNRPEAIAQWRAWQEETQRASRTPGPVSRREVRSDEPPALVIMRDRFPAVLGVSLAAATLMFGFLGWALRGSCRSARPSDKVSDAMTTPAVAQIAPRRNPPPSVTWRSHPLEEGGRTAWLLLAIVSAVALAVELTTGDSRCVLLVCGLLALCAWRFFVPVYFDVNHQGIHRELFGWRRRVPWKSVSACEICRDGLYVVSAGGWLNFGRGLYVPWSTHREEVLALADYYLAHVRHDDRLYGFDLGR